MATGVYVGSDGKARKVKGGYIGIDGVARKIKKGYIGDENGVARLCWYAGKKLSEYTVGSIVYLLENGIPVEYLVVNHGLPNKTLYDSSCDGVWLLRKDIYETRAWDTNTNNYQNSDIHAYLNSDFLSVYDSGIQSAIKTAKIPYTNGTGSTGSVASGANGLSTKVFLLGGYEVGWTVATHSYFPIDGACLTYFSGMAETDPNRIAYLNGKSTVWWLRSVSMYSQVSVWDVLAGGGKGSNNVTIEMGVRPSLILPYDAEVDPNTNIVTG